MLSTDSFNMRAVHISALSDRKIASNRYALQYNESTFLSQEFLQAAIRYCDTSHTSKYFACVNLICARLESWLSSSILQDALPSFHCPRISIEEEPSVHFCRQYCNKQSISYAPVGRTAHLSTYGNGVCFQSIIMVETP